MSSKLYTIEKIPESSFLCKKRFVKIKFLQKVTAVLVKKGHAGQICGFCFIPSGSLFYLLFCSSVYICFVQLNSMIILFLCSHVRHVINLQTVS